MDLDMRGNKLVMGTDNEGKGGQNGSQIEKEMGFCLTF